MDAMCYTGVGVRRVSQDVGEHDSTEQFRTGTYPYYLLCISITIAWPMNVVKIARAHSWDYVTQARDGRACATVEGCRTAIDYEGVVEVVSQCGLREVHHQ